MRSGCEMDVLCYTSPFRRWVGLMQCVCVCCVLSLNVCSDMV